MNNSKTEPNTDFTEIQIDLEADVPTVRFDLDQYRNDLDRQVYDEFWGDLCWTDPNESKDPIEGCGSPITQRAIPKR